MDRTKIVMGACLLLCGVACGADKQREGAADSGMPDGGGSGRVGGSSGTGVNTGGSGGASVGSGGMGGSGGTGGSAGTDEDGGAEETADGGDPPTELPDDGERLSVCLSNDDCTGDDLSCTEFGYSQGFCAQNCSGDDDCDAIDGLKAICDLQDRCVVACGEQDGGAGECPNNMECVETAGSQLDPTYRCQYPKDGEVYDRCDINRDDADCMEGLTCLRSPSPTDPRVAFCAEGCEEASDCGDLGNNATPVCDPAPLAFPSSGICALECEKNSDCPDNLDCLQVDIVMKRCTAEYPL